MDKLNDLSKLKKKSLLNLNTCNIEIEVALRILMQYRIYQSGNKFLKK